MNYHLLKANGEWRLREEGSKNDIYTTETKAAALKKLSEYMESAEGEVLVHKADGAIQEHRTYLADEQGGLSKKGWSIIGVVTAVAITAASLAYVFRDSIPVDRLRLR
jgi:hypothetical protein